MEENINQEGQGGTPVLKALIIQGGTYLTTLTRKYENRLRWIKPDARQVISFIPGTIKQVLVRVGDIIKAEDKLLVIESMKMMNTIYSPLNGKIKSVLVKEGDRTPKGTVMIVFE